MSWLCETRGAAVVGVLTLAACVRARLSATRARRKRVARPRGETFIGPRRGAQLAPAELNRLLNKFRDPAKIEYVAGLGAVPQHEFGAALPAIPVMSEQYRQRATDWEECHCGNSPTREKA